MKYWQALPTVMASLVMPAQTTNAIPPMPAPPAAAVAAQPPPAAVENSVNAVNYGRLKGSTDMDFHGTSLMPGASGRADVKSKPGGTAIKAKFKDMPPASSFGGEYLTYVLWGVSTEGRATNLGELVIKDGKGKIKATDPLQTFAMVVTAEPYFAVTQPSAAVVMENVVTPEAASQAEPIVARYQIQKVEPYAVNMDPAGATVMDKNTPSEVYQARNAVRIAQAAGAPTFAQVAFAKAQADLAKAEIEGASRKDRIMNARASIQSAEEARNTAAREQGLELEARNQAASQDQLETARMGQDAAVLQATVADSQRDAALQQATVADAQKDAALQQATAADAQKDAALQQAAVADAQLDAAASSAPPADAQKDAAMGETDAVQADADVQKNLLAEFNSVLETRATARGLVVNMNGVMFQTGTATLLPPGRAKLAKIAGILASHKGLMVAPAGITGTPGTPGSRLRLAKKRADNAVDYLVSQGATAGNLADQGAGEDQAIASTSAGSGRKENHGVELVVYGEGITGPPADGM